MCLLLLTTAPMLVAPNFSLPFSMAVDASDLGAGAVLLQPGNYGLEHPVCFYSRKFNRHQRAYSTKEKEALGLFWPFNILKITLEWQCIQL